MPDHLLSYLNKSREDRKKLFALLVDPDSTNEDTLAETISHANESGVDIILVGGSIITNGLFEKTIETIKKSSKIPVLIFPGNMLQISNTADGILLLSLISGRNPELLIGKHVISAPILKGSGIEILPTGYILIDGGKNTSVSYMSHTTPIPADKDAIAMCTAMAGTQLGLRIIYMDAGSGALQPVSESMIRKVAENIEVPLFIGGGIRSAQQAIAACKAGADVIVVGNAAEKEVGLIKEIAEGVHGC